jgi:hypothetical protein
MASSFAWKTLIAFKIIAFSFDPHSPFDKPKTLNYIEYIFVAFVENNNSDIKVICSDLHIFCHNVSVQDKG